MRANLTEQMWSAQRHYACSHDVVHCSCDIVKICQIWSFGFINVSFRCVASKQTYIIFLEGIPHGLYMSHGDARVQPFCLCSCGTRLTVVLTLPVFARHRSRKTRLGGCSNDCKNMPLVCTYAMFYLHTGERMQLCVFRDESLSRFGFPFGVHSS